MSISFREGGDHRPPSVEVGIDTNHLNPSDIRHAMETLDSSRTHAQMLVIKGSLGYAGIVGTFKGTDPVDRVAIETSAELEELGEQQEQSLLG